MEEDPQLTKARKKASTELSVMWKEIKKQAEKERGGGQKPVAKLGLQAKLTKLDALIKKKPPDYDALAESLDDVHSTLVKFFNILRKLPNEGDFAQDVYEFAKVLQTFKAQTITIQRAHGTKSAKVQQAYVEFKKVDSMMEIAWEKYEKVANLAVDVTDGLKLEKLQTLLRKYQESFVGLRERRNNALEKLMRLEDTI